jgi:hypothetical protein
MWLVFGREGRETRVRRVGSRRVAGHPDWSDFNGSWGDYFRLCIGTDLSCDLSLNIRGTFLFISTKENANFNSIISNLHLNLIVQVLKHWLKDTLLLCRQT